MHQYIEIISNQFDLGKKYLVSSFNSFNDRYIFISIKPPSKYCFPIIVYITFSFSHMIVLAKC